MKKFCLYMLLFVQLNLQSFSSNLEFQYFFPITIMDNPAPGYLRFDWPKNQEFTVIDNYGNLLTERTENYYSVFRHQLRNGMFVDIMQNKFLIFNENMQVVDSIPNPTPYVVDFHDFISLSNGRYLMLVNEYLPVNLSEIVEGGQADARIINNRLVETDRTGTIYWQWSSYDHLNILDCNEDVDLTQKFIDYAHINSMFEDASGNILVSIRNYDEIALISKSTGQFIWRMGGSTCKNNQFTFVNDDIGGFKGFSHQHTASFLPNGNILLFDNGNSRSNPFSRAVEYSVNHSAKTVTKVWEYMNNPPTYNQAMGSAYRLENGNTLINWSIGKITEVRNDKSIALQLDLDVGFPVYRAQKIRFKGLKHASQNISNTGNYTYSGINGNTDVTMTITGISGSTMTHVQKHAYKPAAALYSDSLFSQVLPHRFVFTPDKSNITVSGIIKIKTSGLTGSFNPAKLLIYKRAKEGDGVFTMLQTTYNQSAGEISASFSGWGEFVVAVSSIEAPTLESPANGEIRFPIGMLSWKSVRSAIAYNVQISKNNNFSTIERTGTVNHYLRFQYENLEYNTKYFWRVRALNAIDTSEWSSVNHFFTTIAPPKLVSPENHFIGVKTKDILSWNSVESANSYQVQIGLEYNFSQPVVNQKNISGTKFEFQQLMNNIEYLWRVRAFKGTDSSQWSEVFTFRTTLANPRLSTPANKAKNISTEQLFTWDYINGAENYSFELSQNDDEGRIVHYIESIKDSKILINDLDFGENYRWRVKAKRNTDSSEWSEYSTFTTAIEPVKLLYPANNATNVNVEIRFNWEKLEGNVLYNIEIAYDTEFNNLFLKKDSINVDFYQIDELKPNSMYFWRVKAFKGENESIWSETRNFHTGKGLELLPPVLLAPKNGDEALSEVLLQWNRRLKAVKYRMQISTNRNFIQNFADVSNITETHFNATGLKENTEYFWRVKAYSLYDSSSWSEAWSMSIIRPGKIVQLLQPGNDELQVPIEGKLEWQSVSGVDYYTVQISEELNFQNTVFDSEVYNLDFFNYVHLKYNTKYYWRVRYVSDDFISDWSAVWEFTTQSQTVLGMPEFTSHVSGTVGIPVEGTIEWKPVKDATEYQISFSNQRNFSTFIFRHSGLLAPKLDYTGLDYGSVYFIRVSASNSTSKSSWSEPIYLTTELESPNIIFPVNGDLNVPKVGAIIWTLQNVNSIFHLQISMNREFSQIIAELNNFDYLNYNFSLDDDTYYYCRVKSYNDTNSSKWSEIVSFKTRGLSSVKNNDDSRAYKVYPNPSIDFITIDDLPENVIINVKISDMQGRNLIDIKNYNVNDKIDVSNLSSGIFIISVNEQSRIFIKLE